MKYENFEIKNNTPHVITWTTIVMLYFELYVP